MTIRQIEHTAPPGGTHYAYPARSSATYSLANWTTHRVQLVELAAPNLGNYQGNVDDEKGMVWYIFSGASQPSDWGQAVAVVDFSLAVDVDGFTLEESLRLMAAVLVGEVSGAGTTTERFEAIDGSKERVAAVTDRFGNRTSITRDAT
jgi:hypothetical protein